MNLSILSDGLIDEIILCIFRHCRNSTSPLTSTSPWSKSSDLTPQSDVSSISSEDSTLARTNVHRVQVHLKCEQCVKHATVSVRFTTKRKHDDHNWTETRDSILFLICFLRVRRWFSCTKNESFLISSSNGCISFKLVFLFLSE